MSPENTHKLMGFYMEVLILGVNTLYRLFCFFKPFPMVDKGLMYFDTVSQKKDLQNFCKD